MIFISKLFWLAFVVAVVVLWLLPPRLRKIWLLIVSYAFYATWSIPYGALLFGVTSLNHLGARWMVAGDRTRRGKVVIAGNLLLLGAFKYLAWVMGLFVSATAWAGLHVTLPIPAWALPLGISFYTFELMSYVVDLMRKREKLHSFWDFQLFIAFFPKLVSGPILRAKEFLPQLEERTLRLKASDVRLGVRQIAIGLVLKLLLADSLAGYVNGFMQRGAARATALDVWVIALAFGIQVYFDFSAYTRLAIGCAKLCGVELVENFNHPFTATSPADFWQRWHMSLSRWVRDYVFYPLAQSPVNTDGPPDRVRLRRRLILVRAAFVSMVIFGIWHGASGAWTAYGVYYGAVLGAYHLLTFRERAPERAPVGGSVASSMRGALVKVGSWALTMVVMTLGFLFARAPNLGVAFGLIGRALRPLSFPGRTLNDYTLFRVLALFAVVVGVGVVARLRESKQPAPQRPEPGLGLAGLAGLAEGLAVGALLVFALMEMLGTQTTFVYFQF